MNLLIGNGLSFVAAIFTIKSSISHGHEKIYFYQALQCFFMAIASIFFLSFAGVTTFILCTIRNLILAKGKYTKKVYLLFLILITGLGLLSNNRGLLGLLPVITTVIYSVGQYYLKTDMTIKGNITLNLIFWAIYDFIILDLVSGIVDSISALTTISAMIYDQKSASH